MAYDWSFLEEDKTTSSNRNSGSLLSEPIEKDWEFRPLDRMESSVQQSFGSLWGAASAVADAVGWDTASDWAANRAGELFQEAADKELVNTNFSDISSVSDAGKWAVETITSFIPDLALMSLGGAGLGSVAGKTAAKGYGTKVVEKMLSKGFKKNLDKVILEGTSGLSKNAVYKEAIKRTATDAGRLLGVTGTEGLQGTGQSFILDRDKRGEEANPYAAFAVGGVQSAIAMFNPLNKVLAGRGFGKGKNIFKMTIGEASEELGQELTSMAHESGIDPNTTFGDIVSSKEGRARLLESGFAGALLGTTFGGGLDYIDKGRTNKPTTPQEDTLTSEKTLDVESTLEEVGIDTSQDAKSPIKVENDKGVAVSKTFEEKKRSRFDNMLRRRESFLSGTSQTTPEISKKAEPYPRKVEPLNRSTEEIQQEIRQKEYLEILKELDEGTINPPSPTVQETEEITPEGVVTSEGGIETEATKSKGITNVQEVVQPRTIDNILSAVDKIESGEIVTEPIGNRFNRDERSGRNIRRFDENKPSTIQEDATTPIKEVTQSTQEAIPDREKTPDTVSTLEEEASVPDSIQKEIKATEEASAPLPEQSEDIIQEKPITKDRNTRAKEQTDRENKDILETAKPIRKSGDWESTSYEVDKKKKIPTYKKDKSVIVKHHTSKFQLVVDKLDHGFFKSLKDAKQAEELDQTSKEFYKRQDKDDIENIDLEESQVALLSDLDFDKVISKAQTITRTQNEGLEDQAMLGIYRAARDFKVNEDLTEEQQKKRLFNYAVSKSVGAIRDYKKNPKNQREVQSIKIGDTGTDSLDLATKEDIENFVPDKEVPKRSKRKSIEELPEEERPSEVKEISVEQYLKENKDENLEDKADNLATIYSLNSKSSKEALDKFDSAYTTLSPMLKEARKILQESVDIDEKFKTRHEGTFKDGLEVMQHSATSKHQVVRTLAKYLINNVAVRNKLRKTEVGTSESGTSYYNQKENKIYLGTTNKTIALHEAVHAFTSREVQENTKLGKRVDNLLSLVRARAVLDGIVTESELESIVEAKSSRVFKKLDIVKKKDKSNLGVAYGLLNSREFISQAFSSKSFQDYMKTVKLKKPQGYIKTLWDRFVSSIGNLLGLSQKSYTALDEILTLTPELARVRLKGKSTEVSESLSEKTFEDRVDIMKKNDTLGSPKDALKSFAKRSVGLLKDLGKTMTERLRKIDPKLIGHVRRMEFNILNKNREYQNRIKPFVDSYNKLSQDDRLLLDLTLMNNTKEDISKRDEILKRNNMEDSYKGVEKVLQEIYNRKEGVALNKYGEVPEYFPRRVKNVGELIKTINESEDYNSVKQLMDSIPDDATEADKEKAVQQMINTGRLPTIALKDPTSSKRRSISRVSSEWKHHYFNSIDSLVNHIYESNEAIESRKLFGDTTRKARLDEANKLRKELEDPKLKGVKREKKLSKLMSLESILEDTDSEITNGISQFLIKNSNDLTTDQVDEIIRLMRGRLAQKGMSGPLASIRNIGLITALGSPTSAITQIGDLAFSVYKYGAKDTIEGLIGDRVIKPKDLDLSHSMKEFQNEGSAKWLDKVLRWSGLQFMDTLGKTTTMNAAYSKASKMPLEKFSKEYSHILKEDTEQTWKDLKGKKNTDLTRFFVFNEMSNWQPVSMSEMPLKYLEAGNGRLFYALKTYNIKAINNLYRELVHVWRTSKSKTERAKAAVNTGKLLMLMTFMGATADELKDLLLQNEGTDFSDKVHENILKTAMMSRYTLDQGWSKGIFETLLKDVLIPPTGVIDSPLSDIYNTFKGDPDWKTVSELPWGKIPYYWFSGKQKKRSISRLRSNILSKVKSGTPISSLREDINKYNKKAKEMKEPLITYSTLRRAIRSSVK